MDNALSILALQFEDEDRFNECVEELRRHLKKTPNEHIMLRNERGEAIAFNPEYYHSLWAGPTDWPMPDWLPRTGPDGS